MKCNCGVSWPKGNKSPSLMHDCFLYYMRGAVGDGGFLWRLGGGYLLFLVLPHASSKWSCTFLCLVLMKALNEAMLGCGCSEKIGWSFICCSGWPRVRSCEGDHIQVMRRQVVTDEFTSLMSSLEVSVWYVTRFDDFSVRLCRFPQVGPVQIVPADSTVYQTDQMLIWAF